MKLILFTINFPSNNINGFIKESVILVGSCFLVNEVINLQIRNIIIFVFVGNTTITR